MNILPERRVSAGQLMMMAVLFILLAVTVVWASGLWVVSGDTALPYRAWTALTLGTVFAVVVGCGLMALMFYSSRRGYDERAVPKFERPGRRGGLGRDGLDRDDLDRDDLDKDDLARDRGMQGGRRLPPRDVDGPALDDTDRNDIDGNTDRVIAPAQRKP